MTETRVLFVCMGNICRSPTAEAVFRHVVVEAGLEKQIVCDSAGTHDYHIGHAPDARSVKAAARRGYDMTALRARQVSVQNFHDFNWVLAMDSQNLSVLQRLAPRPARARLQLFGDLHADYAGQDEPDPYYGGADGFESVLDMVETINRQLLEILRVRRR